MRASRAGAYAAALPLLVVVLAFGCGHDRNASPGPGGSTFIGNVSNASTSALSLKRNTWLAWLREELIGFARPAYAQTPDNTLGGITVIVRGGGRELSDLTDNSGNFRIDDAPTGEVTVLFRRGSCQGALPIGGVVSSATMTLSGVSFVCTPGSDVGTVTFGSLEEHFLGVTRDNPSDATNVRLCTRVGNDDVLRTVDLSHASVFDTNGNAATFGDIAEHDRLLIDGFRNAPGDTFTYDAHRVDIQEHNVTDECAGT